MSPSSEWRVADAIVAQLAAVGVKRVYGVVGDGIFPLADALAKQRQVQWIAAAHESGAALMASYEAKLTGQLAVCAATAGPGATNLATGLADAHFDGAPVLALTGQVATTRFGTGAKQYFDQQSFFRPIVSATELVLGAQAALHGLTRAITRALLNRQAVHLSVPADVWTQAVAWTPLPLKQLPDPHADGIAPEDNRRNGTAPEGTEDGRFSTGSSQAVPLTVGHWERAVETVRRARRPLVVLGEGNPAAVKEARRLIGALGAAAIAAQHVKGALPDDDEHVIGGIGEAHVPALVEQADVVIIIGEPGYEAPFLPQAPTIAFSAAPRAFAEGVLVMAAVGDVPALLRAFRVQVDGAASDPAWREAIAAARQGLAAQRREVMEADTSGPVNPYRLAIALGRAAARDAIVTLDVGAFTHWFDLGFSAANRRILASPVWRSLGSALPGAIAAQLACPDREVIAITGDGGMMMALAELVTAVDYRLPITVIVLRNDGYDIERQKMAAQHLRPLGTRPRFPDFAAYARACGASSATVSDPTGAEDALRDALARARESGAPVLVEVRTSVPALPHMTS